MLDDIIMTIISLMPVSSWGWASFFGALESDESLSNLNVKCEVHSRRHIIPKYLCMAVLEPDAFLRFRM